MVVIIPHATEELKLAAFQKELIEALFSDDRIIYRTTPLWIEVSEETAACNKDSLIAFSKTLQLVELGEVELEKDNIFIPVRIQLENRIINSKLTLVRLHKGRTFDKSDSEKLAKIKQPVRQLKVFRLGMVQEEGPHAKSISKAVWCKLK